MAQVMEVVVMVIKHPARLVMEALVLILFLVLAEVAAADHSWGSYHWARTSNPFTLQLGDNLTNSWDPYLATTARDWNEPRDWSLPTAPYYVGADGNPLPDVINPTVVPGKNSKPKLCRAVSGRVEVCNASYGNNGWLGVAQIWASWNHITQGTVKVNDTYFNTSTYNTPAWRNMVMCQEVGHTLGLDHQDEAFDNANLGTCMDYTSNPSTNQHPNQHDYEQLALIYAHLDSTTTLSATTQATAPLPPAVNGDLNSVREWGRLVRSRNGGRTETYERDLGHGHKVVTHVIWAF